MEDHENAPMLEGILSFAQRKDQVKCYTPRGSGCMLVPEAIFFRIICHFKKVFYKVAQWVRCVGNKGEVQGGWSVTEWPVPRQKYGKIEICAGLV